MSQTPDTRNSPSPIPQTRNADKSWNRNVLRMYHIDEPMAESEMSYETDDGVVHKMMLGDLLGMESAVCPAGGWTRRDARQGLEHFRSQLTNVYSKMGVDTTLVITEQDIARDKELTRREAGQAGGKNNWGQL